MPWTEISARCKHVCEPRKPPKWIRTNCCGPQVGWQCCGVAVVRQKSWVVTCLDFPGQQLCALWAAVGDCSLGLVSTSLGGQVVS